jgi:transcriptional regulator with XRE-family HTH domain
MTLLRMIKTMNKPYSTKAVGSRIRIRRDHIGLSREDLAQLAGISVRQLADIELGHTSMSVKSLVRLVEVLNVSADYILFGQEIEENDVHQFVSDLLKHYDITKK